MQERTLQKSCEVSVLALADEMTMWLRSRLFSMLSKFQAKALHIRETNDKMQDELEFAAKTRRIDCIRHVGSAVTTAKEMIGTCNMLIILSDGKRDKTVVAAMHYAEKKGVPVHYIQSEDCNDQIA